MGLFKDIWKKPAETENNTNKGALATMPEPKEDLLNETFVAQTNEEPETVVEKGILIFHDDKGDLRYKQIGEVSIENITYYRRYLDQLEKGLWEQRIGGIENA